MNQKCIWIINQYAGSPNHGMEFRHYYISKELIDKGYKVLIISGSFSHLFTKLPNISGDYTFEEIELITYCWVKIPRYKNSLSIKRVYNMLVFSEKLRKFPSKQFSKPDVIIVSSPSLFPIIQANRWAKKYKAKLIFEVRDIWPLTVKYLGNLSTYNPLIILMQWFENFAYRRSNKIISVLPGAMPHMISHGMADQKFIYIPNGIDLNENKKAEQLDNAIAKSIPANKFVIGYVGTIGKANALEYFIQSAYLLKDEKQIHFVIVGNGNAKTKLISDSSGLNNITFLNSIKKSQVPDMLEKFDACYIGWRKEGLYRFGISANKLFDYMYSGKPIIHSVEAFNDPIAEACCGISIPPENPNAIANAINRLLSMPMSDRIRLGEKGKTYVSNNYSYKKLAEKFVSIF